MYRRLYTQTESFLPDKFFVPEGELFNTRMTKIPRAGKLLRGSQRRPDDPKPKSLARGSQTR
jgi:hypothetical protein